MSFWPFPKTAIEELDLGQRLGPALDVGSGSGTLADRLRTHGIDLLRLDLAPTAQLRADAMAMPFATARLGACVAANLVRHFVPSQRRDFFLEMARVLVARGSLVLVEDLPEASNAAEANYRRALDLLALVDTSRGAALELDPLLSELAPDFGQPVLDAEVMNEEPLVDPATPLRWLALHGLAGDARLLKLERNVEREGMRYGRFRICCLRRGANAWATL
ncbi:hypothetical protein DRQ53_11365 [bacterium]|nr:MAG: hypothetical protein DRQ53_11365 [bacterium]